MITKVQLLMLNTQNSRITLSSSTSLCFTLLPLFYFFFFLNAFFSNGILLPINISKYTIFLNCYSTHSTYYSTYFSNAIVRVRLPSPWSGDNQYQETFLAASAYNQTLNYDTDHQPSLPTLSVSRDWAVAKWNGELYTYKFTSECHSHTTPSFEWR